MGVDKSLAQLAAQAATQQPSPEQQRIAQLEAVLAQRAIIQIEQLVDALGWVSQLAAQGNPHARGLLQSYFEALERARSSASGITLAR